MKRISMAALTIAGAGLLASTAPASTPNSTSAVLQESCSNAATVAREYLANQASAERLTYVTSCRYQRNHEDHRNGRGIRGPQAVRFRLPERRSLLPG
jgi:hypothetical protein